MSTTIQRAFLLLACAALSSAATAQSFIGLGDLPGGDFESFPRNLSADGKFVTGSSSTTNGTGAFLWTEDTGMVGLGNLPEVVVSNGLAVSNDGSKVIGTYFDPTTTIQPQRAFQWTSGSGVVDFDPFPVGAVDRDATGLSADGSAIIGSYRSAPFAPKIVYLWNGSELTEIAPSGFAGGISADGTVVVGNVFLNPNGPPPFIEEALLWSDADGTTGLGYLPGGSQFSGAYGVSANGQVVVGISENASSDIEAFRWTEAGGMVGLGDLPGGIFSSFASDTTADGSIVVGTSNVASGAPPTLPDDDPFIWDEFHGMRNLVDVFINDYGLGSELVGWNLSEATAISDDGTVIIGIGTNPAGNFEAWRVVLVPEPSTVLLSAFACVGLLAFRRHSR